MQRVKRGLDKHSAGGVEDEADGVGEGGGTGLLTREVPQDHRSCFHGSGDPCHGQVRARDAEGKNDYENKNVNEGMGFAGRRRGAPGMPIHKPVAT